DDLYSLIPASDGGYIAFGETSSNNSGSDFTSLGAIDIFVFKFNESGNIIWKKTFGGTGYERGGNIRATADGGYIIASSTNTPT
ncbi:hypothetical protein, partial [Rhizobium leguminosarum]|uniref:hypothetical protein n=1 Tax=Rhizobium leguminosarum TaxID=384 RepID=UPI003F9D5A41